MADLPWSTAELTRSLRSGSKTCLATGSSWRTASRITSAWWSCTWAFPTGNMLLPKQVLIHKRFSGLGFWYLKDLPLILKIARIKSILIERGMEIKISRIRIKISLNLLMTKSKLKVSKEREEEWSSRQNPAWRMSSKSFRLNRVKPPSMPKLSLKREIRRSSKPRRGQMPTPLRSTMYSAA